MHPRVAGGHLIQTGGDLSLGQKAVANQLAAAVGSELLMRSNPLGDLLLNGLGKHPLGSLAEKARKNIVGRWRAPGLCTRGYESRVGVRKPAVCCGSGG